MEDFSLDLIGIAEGTDKHSLHHDYLRHYERMFRPFRHEAIDVLEIGVLNGASLRTWRRFFTRARIIGVDIDSGCSRYAGDNVVIEVGSQEDPAFLTSLCRKYRPSIVIDDGSHLAFDVEFTFEHLFPGLTSGGCYVIEDVQFHFGEPAQRHSIGARETLPDYLLRLERPLLGEPDPAGESRGFRRWLTTAVDRIEVFHSAYAIWKTQPQALSNADIEQIEHLVADSQVALSWHLLALSLIKFGQIDRAEQASRRAIQLDARNWEFPARLAVALEIKGDLAGAEAALESGLSLAGKNESLIAHLQNRLENVRQRQQTGS